jgi:hypothetical protein
MVGIELTQEVESALERNLGDDWYDKVSYTCETSPKLVGTFLTKNDEEDPYMPDGVIKLSEVQGLNNKELETVLKATGKTRDDLVLMYGTDV